MEIGDYINTGISLGKGTFGNVDLARNIYSNETFAIKKIHVHHIRKPNLLTLELSKIKCVNHPNIVSIKEAIMSPTYLHLVMKYVYGDNLHDQVKMYGVIPEHMCVKYMRQLCEALFHAHRMNIWHGNIKPENILIDEKENINILDLGLSRIININSIGQTEKQTLDNKISNLDLSENQYDEFEKSMSLDVYDVKNMSTINPGIYEPPEFLSCNDCFGDKSDIWSLGVICYFILSGEFPNESIKKKFKPIESSIITNDANDFIEATLKKDYMDRYSASQLLGHPWLRKEKFRPFQDRKDRVISDSDSESGSDCDDISVYIENEIDRYLFINTLKEILEYESWVVKIEDFDVKISQLSQKGLHLLKIHVSKDKILISNEDTDSILPTKIMNSIHNIVLKTITIF